MENRICLNDNDLRQSPGKEVGGEREEEREGKGGKGVGLNNGCNKSLSSVRVWWT